MVNNSERLKNSYYNVVSNFFIYFFQIVFSFVIRMLFIKKLGQELLGLDGLLINMLAMMSIAELGIGSAICFCLYKPIAKGDNKKISLYMSFYKRIYRYLGFIVLMIGLVILLFLKYVVHDCHYDYLYFAFFIYLFDTVSMYFVSYKDVLLISNQKYYKVFKYDCIFKFLLYILQIVVLLVNPSYITYLLVMVFFRFCSRFFINRYITNEYKDIDFDSKKMLSKKEIMLFKKKVYGLCCFRIGYYVINCSDNIIISSMIGIVMVGIYTNYLSIVSILRTTIKSIFNGITASFGNLSVEYHKESERRVFSIMSFLGFIIYGYVTSCLLILINPFICFWLGEKFVLPFCSVIIICINFYLMCNQLPMDVVKEACGFYSYDRYVPIYQAIINVILSILLCMFLGFNGVILATAISYLVTVFWNKPLMLYRHIFKDSCRKYFFNQLKYIVTMVIVYFINYYVFLLFDISLSLIYFIVSGIVIGGVYFCVVSLLYFRQYEYKFLFQFIKEKIINRK